MPHHARTLAIVDDPASLHGQRMAAVLDLATCPIWILPALDLVERLDHVQADVVAMPLRVRGGHLNDPFTRAVAAAIARLRARRCAVFVAQGSHPNPLARVATPIRAPFGIHTTASAACVAAAEAALFGLDRKEIR